MPTRIDRIARRAPRALVLREERASHESGPVGRKQMSKSAVDDVLNQHMDRIANSVTPLSQEDAAKVAKYLGRVDNRMKQEQFPQ